MPAKHSYNTTLVRKRPRGVSPHLSRKVEPPDRCVHQAGLLEHTVAPVEPVLVDLRGVEAVVDLVGHHVLGVTEGGGPDR